MHVKPARRDSGAVREYNAAMRVTETPEHDVPETDTALLFPGQGSQEPGMQALVRAHCPELLERMQDALGENPYERLEHGTVFLQPAIYCASIAAWRSLGEPAAGVAAGHSLGELAALVAAGCLPAEQGLELVLTRAQLMQQAADAAPPGGLVAVIGSDREAALELAGELGLTLATDNEPRQAVLAGPVEALDRLAARVAERGLRAVRLEVAGALHSPAMAAAAAPFQTAVRAARLRPPRFDVLSNVTAEPFDDDIPQLLAAAIVSCVRWREVVLALDARGVRRFVEPGPGTVLTGLVRRVLRSRAPSAA